MENQENLSSKLKAALSKNKSIIIIIVILSFMSFSATGYLLLSNKKPSLSNKLTQEHVSLALTPTSPPMEKNSDTSPSATPTPAIPVVNPTATWSAFVSTKYSYSIKYFPAWTARITTQSDPKILEYVVFNPVATKAGTLSITLSYGTRTYLEALALDPQIGENIRVASVSATKKNSKDSNGNTAVNIIVPFGSNTIIFNAKSVFADLFNQTLSTLKLTK